MSKSAVVVDRSRQGRQRKKHQPALVDATVAEHVAEEGQRQQGDDNRYLIGVNDPY